MNDIFLSAVLIIVFFTLLTFLKALILQMTLFFFKVAKIRYRVTLLIVFIITIALIFVAPIIALIPESYLQIIFTLIFSFLIFQFLLKRKYSVNLTRALLIYLSNFLFQLIIISTLVIVVQAFLIKPFNISGIAMHPTLKDGETIIIKKFDKSYEKNEIVVFKKDKNQAKAYYASRIIALPGDKVKIKDGFLYINDELQDSSEEIWGDIDLKLGENEYFILSDNQANSAQDSRTNGPLEETDIIGGYLMRLDLSSL